MKKPSGIILLGIFLITYGVTLNVSGVYSIIIGHYFDGNDVAGLYYFTLVTFFLFAAPIGVVPLNAMYLIYGAADPVLFHIAVMVVGIASLFAAFGVLRSKKWARSITLILMSAVIGLSIVAFILADKSHEVYYLLIPAAIPFSIVYYLIRQGNKAYKKSEVME